MPEIVVHVDAATVCHGRHHTSVCETVDGEAVPPAAVQRMCCEAILTAVIVNPDGTIDHICAEQRTANRQQRRMLAAMYATCAHPHCQIGFSQCRIHHIHWFSRGGRTVLANLIPLCDTHHHLVHEGGWHLTITTDRHLTWHQPDGTTWHTDTGPNRTPHQPTTPDTQTSTSRPQRPDPTRRPPPNPPTKPPPPPPAATSAGDHKQQHRPSTHRPRRTSRQPEPAEPPTLF